MFVSFQLAIDAPLRVGSESRPMPARAAECGSA
jgi:hypothetical protein